MRSKRTLVDSVDFSIVASHTGAHASPLVFQVLDHGVKHFDLQLSELVCGAK